MSEQPSKPISRLSRKLRDRERINEQNFNSRRIIKKNMKLSLRSIKKFPSIILNRLTRSSEESTMIGENG